MGLDTAQPTKDTFNSARLAPAQAALVQELLTAKQFAILQDTGGTSHSGTDTAIKDNKHNSLTFLTDPQTAAALKMSGYKNLAMEVRKEFQPLVDKVAKGQMTPEQYAKGVADMYLAAGDAPGGIPSPRAVEIGKVVKAMAANGIKVLCVEGQSSGLKQHGESVDRIDAAKKAYADIATENIGAADLAHAAILAAKAKVSHMTDGSIFSTADQELMKLFESVAIAALKGQSKDGMDYSDVGANYKAVMEDRMKGYVQLAKTIKSLVGNEKTAVYYGSAHGSLGYDLDEALGGAKKIGLYADDITIKRDMQYDYMHRLQIPDAAISISDGKSFNKDQLDKMILKDAPQVPLSAAPILVKP
jgi:hypothetical protein